MDMTKSDVCQFLTRGTKNAHCVTCVFIPYAGFSQIRSQIVGIQHVHVLVYCILALCMCTYAKCMHFWVGDGDGEYMHIHVCTYVCTTCIYLVVYLIIVLIFKGPNHAQEKTPSGT